MDELAKETDEFEETVDYLRNTIAKAIVAEASKDASHAAEPLTYTQIDEATEDNPSLLDYGEYAEILYLEKTQEALEASLHTLRSGDFTELGDSIEMLSAHVAHLKYPGQYQIHLDELQNTADILASKTANLERYTEKVIIEPEVILGVSDELMSYFARKPAALYNVDPRLFEEIVAEIFRKFGFEATLTKQTHDGGYDIFAIEQRDYAHNKYIIECK